MTEQEKLLSSHVLWLALSPESLCDGTFSPFVKETRERLALSPESLCDGTFNSNNELELESWRFPRNLYVTELDRFTTTAYASWRFPRNLYVTEPNFVWMTVPSALALSPESLCDGTFWPGIIGEHGLALSPESLCDGTFSVS